MEHIKLDRVLNLLLGVSWSFLTFGTAFTFAFSIYNLSLFTAIISTFIIFFFFSILVIFLESIKNQIKQNKDIEEVLKYVRDMKKDNILEKDLDANK